MEVNDKKALSFALVSVGLWSTVAVSFKFALAELHFIHFLFVAVSTALIISVVSLLASGKWRLWKTLKREQWAVGVLGGFLNPFLYYLMLFKAYAILPAQIAQALNYAWPIMLVLLSVPFLGQKLRWNSFLSLLPGFVGVYFIASEGSPWPLQPAEPWGLVIALLSSVVWAGYWLLNKRVQMDAMVGLTLNFASGWVLILPLLFFVPLPVELSAKAGLAALYAGVFEMGLTFLIWLKALRFSSRTDKISNYVFLSPFISLFFIHFVLGEHIYFTTLLGLAMIVASVLWKALAK